MRGWRTCRRKRVEAMFDAFLAHYEAHVADKSHLYDGVVPALDRFAAAGWRFAVCTNKFEHPAVRLLSELGIADRFAAICGQNTFAVCKPAARRPLRHDRRAPAACRHRRSWSAIRRRTSPPPAMPACLSSPSISAIPTRRSPIMRPTRRSAISTRSGTPSRCCGARLPLDLAA